MWQSWTATQRYAMSYILQERWIDDERTRAGNNVMMVAWQRLKVQLKRSRFSACNSENIFSRFSPVVE